jgi:hypothetical protein
MFKPFLEVVSCPLTPFIRIEGSVGESPGLQGNEVHRPRVSVCFKDLRKSPHLSFGYLCVCPSQKGCCVFVEAFRVKACAKAEISEERESFFRGTSGELPNDVHHGYESWQVYD